MRFLPCAFLFIVTSTGLFGEYEQKAPEFQDITRWINSNPLRMTTDLKGKVVLIDFWDYSCINCIRTLPYITKWYKDYKDKGFTVIGVHTPEFSFEHEVANVEKAVKRLGILYPVAMDNDYKITLKFTGTKVHAVLGGASSEPITLLLDGEPLSQEERTQDMDSEGRLYIDTSRKYDLCNLKDSQVHLLTMMVPPGISAYTFTFGSE